MANTRKKSSTTEMKYADRINRTQVEIEQDQKDLNVAEAMNSLEMGILEVKGQMIKAEAQLKKRKSAITTAERKLESAKDSVPFDVNEILIARAEVKQSELDVKADEDVYEQYKSAHDYLVALKSELF